MQLRCGGIYSNHFITHFQQNVPAKKIWRIGQYLTKIWTKVRGLLFCVTLYTTYTTLGCMSQKTVQHQPPCLISRMVPALTAAASTDLFTPTAELLTGWWCAVDCCTLMSYLCHWRLNIVFSLTCISMPSASSEGRHVVTVEQLSTSKLLLLRTAKQWLTDDCGVG